MKLEEVNKRTKDAVDFLVAALESGHSEVLTAYLGATAKVHTYSFGNIMLIARQKPDATNVAGLRIWNSLGRFVKRGQKGIFILAPMIGKKRDKEEDATAEADEKSNGQPRLYGFRGVYVFDISQTEGKELPTLTEVNGDVSGCRERLFKFAESQSVAPLPVGLRQSPRPVDERSRSRITIRCACPWALRCFTGASNCGSIRGTCPTGNQGDGGRKSSDCGSSYLRLLA